jgi:hypothetical protein
MRPTGSFESDSSRGRPPSASALNTTATATCWAWWGSPGPGALVAGSWVRHWRQAADDHARADDPRVPASGASPEQPASGTPKERTSRLEYFHVVLRAAEYPNVALKWSHAHDLFGAHEYPFKRLSPILRRALDPFGPERIMWASDSSVIPEPIWGDMLYPLKSDPELTDEERRWILGASAWRILRWPTSNEG